MHQTDGQEPSSTHLITAISELGEDESPFSRWYTDAETKRD